MSSSEHAAASSLLYCGEDVGDWDADTCSFPPDHQPLSSLSIIGDFSLSNDSTILIRLFDSESDHMPHSDYLKRCRDRSIDVTARQDSINWILKVHAYYHFRPVTAILSVNYLDRFLSAHNLLEQEKEWAFQLLSVGCLSLAAKMEEPQVPPLIDLQVSDPKFVFEPKTIQRMELWIMANLNWRLRSITPFDFLYYFISKLPSSSSSSVSKRDRFIRVLSVSSDLILSTTRVIDFLGFPPSAIAAAALVIAAGETIDLPASFSERLNKEMVRSCHQLMEEYLIDTCPSSSCFKDPTTEPAAPPSPVGVLDAAACKSCDTQKSGSSQAEAEPPSKRVRLSASDVQLQ